MHMHYRSSLMLKIDIFHFTYLYFRMLQLGNATHVPRLVHSDSRFESIQFPQTLRRQLEGLYVTNHQGQLWAQPTLVMVGLGICSDSKNFLVVSGVSGTVTEACICIRKKAFIHFDSRIDEYPACVV